MGVEQLHVCLTHVIHVLFMILPITAFIYQEKEKEIEVRNIYSMRMMKPPTRLNDSVSSTPIPSRFRHRKNSDPSNMMTPREKMKLFEEKRREEDRRKREVRTLTADGFLAFTK